MLLDLRGGRRKIEAQAYPVHYASLRCRLFMPQAMWPTAMRCARIWPRSARRRGRWISPKGLSRPDCRRLFAWRRVVQQGGAAEAACQGCVTGSLEWRGAAHTKKVRSVCWKVAMGQPALGKAAFK